MVTDRSSFASLSLPRCPSAERARARQQQQRPTNSRIKKNPVLCQLRSSLRLGSTAPGSSWAPLAAPGPPWAPLAAPGPALAAFHQAPVAIQTAFLAAVSLSKRWFFDYTSVGIKKSWALHQAFRHSCGQVPSPSSTSPVFLQTALCSGTTSPSFCGGSSVISGPGDKFLAVMPVRPSSLSLASRSPTMAFSMPRAASSLPSSPRPSPRSLDFPRPSVFSPRPTPALVPRDGSSLTALQAVPDRHRRPPPLPSWKAFNASRPLYMYRRVQCRPAALQAVPEHPQAKQVLKDVSRPV